MDIREMNGVAIERWSFWQQANMRAWLTKTFGPSNKETWFEDQDYDLFTLCMNDEVYSMYLLKWKS
jgi:hypothetical protein